MGTKNRIGTTTQRPRPDLEGVIWEWKNKMSQYLADTLFPPYVRTDRVGGYDVMPIEALLNVSTDDTRAYYGEFNYDDFEMERGVYTTRERGLGARIDDVELAEFNLAHPSVQLESTKVEMRMNNLMNAREIRVANMVFNTSGRFTVNDVSTWSDSANADSIADVKTGISYMRNTYGMTMDYLVISKNTFDNLQASEKIQAQLSNTYNGLDIKNVPLSDMARLHDIQILVGDVPYNGGTKNLYSAVNAWSDNYAALVKVSNTPAIEVPCIGRTFVWSTLSPQGVKPTVQQWRDDRIQTTGYNISYYIGEQYLASVDKDGAIVSDISKACIYLMDIS